MKHWYDRTSVHVIFHLLFLLAMWYFFGCNCWLRTAAYPDLYKEYLSGIIAIMVIYLNYYLLFPIFYTQRQYDLYWCLSVFSVVISGAAEMVMVAPNLLNMYSKSGYTDLATHFLLEESLLVTLRNGGLVLFAYALNTILWLQRESEEKDFSLRKKFNFLEVRDKEHKTLIRIRQICYCIQERNVTSIHLTDGTTYLRYNSMNDLEELLGREEFLRISRNVIVQKASISQINDNNVVMKENKSEENPLVFAIGSSYTDIINTHQSYLNYTQEAASTEKEDSESKSTRQLEKIEIVYRYIKTHRFCSVKEISEACHIPYSSVTRYLALLKNSKRIKYKGSRKTGGYIVR